MTVDCVCCVSRCAPCKAIAPKFEALSVKYPSVVFLKLSVDECHNLASRYEVSSVPTFLFFRKGEKIHAVSGFKCLYVIPLY